MLFKFYKLFFFVFALLSLSTASLPAHENARPMTELPFRSADETFVKDVSADSFKDFIGNGRVAVDFYANWCGPCRRFAPIVEVVASELQEVVKVGKLNVDQAGTVCSEIGVRTIPTIVLFEDGVEIARQVGSSDAETFKTFLLQ